jgi:hypothetical protein
MYGEGSGVNRGRQVLVGLVGMVLLGAAAGEHSYRRIIERRYHAAVEDRQQLELQFGEVLATHEQLADDLKNERQHSQELSEALASMRGQLEETGGRLTEQTQNVRELQMRLAAMQQQLDQLQGELAIALQERQDGATRQGSGPVQLERIVVSDAASSGLHGRVVSVHRNWNFVVIDLGWDAVRIGDTISIFRNDQLLAKARIDRVQEGICAATVLPEWETAEIRVNDLVRIL